MAYTVGEASEPSFGTEPHSSAWVSVIESRHRLEPMGANRGAETIGGTMDTILKAIAAVFLALFAGIWLWVAWKLWRFNPTTEVPTLTFSEAIAGTAGLVSVAVASATAGVLGIEIQKGRGSGRTGITLTDAVKASTFLKIGVLTYFIVGVVNLVVWLGNSEVAPEMVGAFALGVLGWMGGAFSAVFQSAGGGGRRRNSTT